MSDKRSVSTDALETLGTIIDETAGRDAIHLAVEPVIAAENLEPGEDVGFVPGGVGKSNNPLGIVDPFLKETVLKGERFWLVVYPRQITSLRHVWAHPAFPEEGVPVPNKLESELWLRKFCSHADCPGYETVMEVIESDGGVQLGEPEYYDKSRVDGDYIHFYGLDAHGIIPAEFWNHVEIVTGKKFKNRPSYFSCSC